MRVEDLTRRPSVRLAVAALILGPAAWTVQVVLLWGLVGFVCEGGYRWLLHVLSAGAAGAAFLGVAAGLRGIRASEREHAEDPSLRSHRTWFLAATGTGLSVISFATVLIIWVQVFFIDPCI